jgi:DNA-binding transcriptional regulator PaaX
MVLFDVPAQFHSERTKLTRYLRNRGFGNLQKSAWISPDPVSLEESLLAGLKIDVNALLFLEARPCAGESDQEIVTSAWDFQRINQYYSRCLDVFKKRPTESIRTKSAAIRLRDWAQAERVSWLEAVTKDPLLPDQLLPAGYLGKRAWSKRIATLKQAAQQIQGFKLPEDGCI